ncbi:MAG: hypothetical protein ACE5ID_12200, partial [Acidobacteriota bacterium]
MMETPHRRQDSGARAAAFLVVLAILLVQGAGLMPGRIGLWADARNYGPWSGSVGQNDRPQPTMVLDSLRYSLAEWTLAHEELGKGRLPLWNPYIFSGFDNAGSIQPAVFSPLKIILALLPPGRGMTLHLLLHTLLLGLGTVLLVRGRGGAGSAAAMAGVTVALNGYLVAKMGQPTAVATLGWLPLLLWSQDRFFRRPRRRQAGVLVLLLLAAALAGHPPYFIYMLLTLALFAAASLWRSPPSRERFCSMLVWGGVALALVGVGTSILPVARGWAGRTSRPLATAERPPLTRPAPQALWGLLVPEPMGSAARGSYAPPAVKLPRGETLGIWHAGVFIYPGVLVWLLLPLA